MQQHAAYNEREGSMLRNLVLVLGLFASAAVQPLAAATIVDTDLNDNLVVDFSEPGTLEIDVAFFNFSPVQLTVRPDANPLTFNSLVSILTSSGVRGLSLVLGGNAAWDFVGSIAPLG